MFIYCDLGQESTYLSGPPLGSVVSGGRGHDDRLDCGFGNEDGSGDKGLRKVERKREN